MLILKKNINTMSEAEYLSVFKRMPQKKRDEVNAYRKEDDKKRTVCAYALAVKALGEFLGKEEKDIVISYTENGQPVFDGAYLSIAHAGDFALCAVSDKKIGIDAEVKRKVTVKTALRVCTKNELEYIFGEGLTGMMPDEYSRDEQMRFLEIWTKKEAYGKMLGVGILYDMKSTDVLDIETYHDGELIVSVTVGG